ncbi:TetR/AcrR family transcriptional regulator [Streptomyces sp. NPDC026672]|uniref:TetR/AcrR family transcriptional regulator n=1 Tax=unclassified Streptomyces TaxID=2593676 RepID=UPI00340CE4C9
MATTDKASPRDRLLDAAAQLFYREGVFVGVEALCRAAGVSKRSMYQQFESKDEVLAESLLRQAPSITAEFEPADPESLTPRERIMYVFERLEKLSVEPRYHGCPYLSVLVEIKDPGHPAGVVARELKARMGTMFRAEAERGGVREPELLARRLMILYDGASARAGSGVERLDDGLLTSTAAVFLDAAGLV